MEEMMDFFKQQTVVNLKYVATYDPFSRKVTSVGPSSAFESEQYKIQIDKETAIDIIEAKVPMSRCFVDENFQQIEFVKNAVVSNGVKKIHRISQKEYSSDVVSDIYITYFSKTKKLKIELDSCFGGTRISDNVPYYTKFEYFNNDSIYLEFFVTGYNDPHVIYEIVKFSISELKNKFIERDIDIPVSKFSYYTLGNGLVKFISETI